MRPAGSTPVTSGSHLPADLCRGPGWSAPHGPRRCPVSPTPHSRTRLGLQVGSSGGARGQRPLLRPRGGSDSWEAWQTFWTQREKSFGSSMGGRSSCRGRSRSSGRSPLLSRALTQLSSGCPSTAPGLLRDGRLDQREERGALGQSASPGSPRRPALGQPWQGAPQGQGAPQAPAGVPHLSTVGTRRPRGPAQQRHPAAPAGTARDTRQRLQPFPIKTRSTFSASPVSAPFQSLSSLRPSSNRLGKQLQGQLRAFIQHAGT